MQAIEMLRQIIDYNRWADELALASIRNQSNTDPAALHTLVHLLIAEREWLLRLTQNKDSSDYNFWPEMNVTECGILMAEVHAAYRNLIGNMAEDKLDNLAIYKNSKGVEYQTKYRDIFLHVMLHSAYHRGQVAMAERASGREPAYTDYIAYVREQQRVA